MSFAPFNKRPNDVFVSYSHADKAMVGSIVRWMQDNAGLRVWWDTHGLRAGDKLGTALPAGLSSSRAALFCVSQHWNDSSWCEDEFNAALQERRQDRRYRVVALKLGDAKIPRFLSNSPYIEMDAFQVDAAAALLRSLVPEPAPWSHSERDVYLSRSWQPSDLAVADTVAHALSTVHGYRLIGDSPDYRAFDGRDRVKRIIESCGALVAVMPFRDDPANGFTSKWIVEEVKLAIAANRPCLLFAAEGVVAEPILLTNAVCGRLNPLPRSDNDETLVAALHSFDEEFQPPPVPAYSFFATSLRQNQDEVERGVQVIEQITGMECLLGQRLRGQHVQQAIIERIRHAEFAVADVSPSNLNSLVEAGIARGSGTKLHLICKRPETGDLHTRFMFRDMEMSWYRDSLEHLGVLHRIARQYRRRIFTTAIN